MYSKFTFIKVAIKKSFFLQGFNLSLKSEGHFQLSFNNRAT